MRNLLESCGICVIWKSGTPAIEALGYLVHEHLKWSLVAAVGKCSLPQLTVTPGGFPSEIYWK